jgi:CDP-paratose 2-epimerase
LLRGDDVIVIDNLSRDGAETNLEWLRRQGCFEFVHLDVRNGQALERLLRKHRDADCVLHLAAQVAVTASVDAPRVDFEINAMGTLNVLEAMRLAGMGALLIYASTNKVYGEMSDIAIRKEFGRYCYVALPLGISELRPLDFHSPYGCSKGASDQYVTDYHRIYGLRTTVFRQSCIYGPRQFGAEDQGWVAWFMIASKIRAPITVYGDGKQVRDILFVEDLLDAYDAAILAGNRAVGRTYNIGGGPTNILSVLELLKLIEKQQQRTIPYEFGPWRAGDQKIFISDIRRAAKELGWTPKIDNGCGLDRLHDWVSNHETLFLDAPSILAR